MQQIKIKPREHIDSTRVTYYDKNEILQILNSLLDVSFNNVNDRIKLQKLAYLAHSLGAFYRYTFSWYAYGPYSSSLMNDLYSAEEVGFFEKTSKPSEDEKRVVDMLKKLLGKNLTNPYKLILYASVWYLLPNKVTKGEKKLIVGIMIAEMRGYTEKDIIKSIDKIVKIRKHISK